MDSLYHHLAKVELHCHLDGSLSLTAIRRLAALANITLPADDQALAALVQAPKDSQDLLDYLKPFDFIRPLLQTKAALRLAAYDVCAQAAAENVRYLELRFAPTLSQDRGLSVAETIQAVVLGLHDAMQVFDITANALVCGMRQDRSGANTAMFQVAAPLLGHGLVGGDFAGDEAHFPTSDLTAEIKAAQALGVPLTLHAGECHCVQNIVQAVAAGITRIGHATALAQAPKAIAAFVNANATAELCLTSNLQTKAIASLAEYPYPQLYAAHAKLTINTDNRTVSATTLTHEYKMFHDHFKTSVADFLTFNLNAANAAFATAADRFALGQRLQQEYAPYL
ncbi:adenosine deaminase [Lacticaseibacillus baoqingensis]|uniref:adenosine deaminase n=1 Tax=Lacticaseibacillus baoqingensis TaxID=2486013 RepID=A0ABW4E4V6_9LACO|nr:adenosine deaminase [Lacticaseibacillus baoqingensis]